MTIRPTPPKITLDHVRPTVVRRRVYEVAPTQVAPTPAGGAPPSDDLDDEDSGPPSSVNVARALASLRGHELKRLDEILTRDDEIALPPPRAAAPAPAAPSVPTVRVGPAIALTELARRMNIAQEELVTALVTRGFFSITVKATLPRDTARAAAAMFGFQVEETDEVLAPKPTLKAKTKTKTKRKTKPLEAKPKSKLAIKSKLSLKTKAKAKPNARSSSPRRTSRRA